MDFISVCSNNRPRASQPSSVYRLGPREGGGGSLISRTPKQRPPCFLRPPGSDIDSATHFICMHLNFLAWSAAEQACSAGIGGLHVDMPYRSKARHAGALSAQLRVDQQCHWDILHHWMCSAMLCHGGNGSGGQHLSPACATQRATTSRGRLRTPANDF